MKKVKAFIKNSNHSNRMEAWKACCASGAQVSWETFKRIWSSSKESRQ